MKKWTLWLPLLLAFSGIAALSLPEAEDLALKNNPRYQAQLSATASARWNRLQAVTGFFPSLTATGAYTYLDPATRISTGMGYLTLNPDTRTYGLSLSQPLFMGGKLWQGYKIAQISEDMANLTLQNQKISILNEVESKYLAVLQLTDALDISRKDLQSTKANLDIAKTRYEAGLLSSADYLKIQAKAASKEVALLQAQTALDLAKQDLLSGIGLEDAPGFEPVDLTDWQAVIDLLSEWNQPQADTFLAQAVTHSSEHNLSLAVVRQSKLLARRTYSLARGGFMPSLVLSFSRSYRDQLERYNFDGSSTFLLSASLPLFPSGTYAATRKAYYEMQKTEFDAKSAEDGIRLSVKAAVLNLISAARQVKAARLSLRMTEQTYEQLSERYKNNLLSVSDMLDGEVMLQAAQLNDTNAAYGFLKAVSTLRQTLGVESDQPIFNLIR